MLSEIPTALAALSNLKDLTKSIVNSKVEAALREQAIESGFAIIEAQSAIMALQTQYQTLLEEKDQLKKQLIKVQDWEATSVKYELTKVADGLFVYALKSDYASAAPVHWLCPDCYQKSEAFVLQLGWNRIRHKHTFNCHHCGLELTDNTNKATELLSGS